jgi:hypothetical protein
MKPSCPSPHTSSSQPSLRITTDLKRTFSMIPYFIAYSVLLLFLPSSISYFYYSSSSIKHRIKTLFCFLQKEADFFIFVSISLFCRPFPQSSSVILHKSVWDILFFYINFMTSNKILIHKICDLNVKCFIFYDDKFSICSLVPESTKKHKYCGAETKYIIWSIYMLLPHISVVCNALYSPMLYASNVEERANLLGWHY